jgi:hypothetical protein
MNTINVPSIETGEFRASATLAGEIATVRFSGTADTGAVDELEILLPRLHSEAVRLRAPMVVVDFRELEFMNSACFKKFVSWLSRVQALDSGQQYRIRFLSDTHKHWQKRSLTALSCFAVDIVEIQQN